MSCYKQAATGLQEVVLGHGISPSTNTEAMLVTGLSLRRSAIDPQRTFTLRLIDQVHGPQLRAVMPKT